MMVKACQNEYGYSIVPIMILVFCIILGSGLLMEGYRIYSIHESVEYQVQRALNVAVEDKLWDSWRMDKAQELDSDEARDRFWAYLATNGVSTSTEYNIDDCRLVEVVGSVAPYLTAEGTIRMDSMFGYLRGGGEIRVPFAARSRNKRTDD
jgi:hypothetical protein